MLSKFIAEVKPCLKSVVVVNGKGGGLKRCAVCAPEHVEGRLRNQFAGRRCKWGESLAVAPDAAADGGNM